MWQSLSIFAILIYVSPSQTKQCLDENTLRKFDTSLFSLAANDHPYSNILISPLSVQTCLEMARVGATGNTASEIDTALTSSTQIDTFIADYYYNILKKYQESSILKIASKMYIKSGTKVKKEFKELLTQNFFSSAEAVDFADRKLAASTINSWVKEKTNNLIKDLVSSDSLSDATQLMLVNAVHFKGEWEHPFDKSKTSEQIFISDKKNFTVQMMRTNAKFNWNYLRELKASIVEMPYRNSNLSMLVIVPFLTSNLNDLEEELKNYSLADLTRDMENESIDLEIPKFTAELEVELSGILKKMGIRRMFSEKAEFYNILKNKGKLFMSSITQKTFIEINEEGAEAAAATDVDFSFRMSPPYIRADRPFHYIIWEKSTRTVVFEGNFRTEPPKTKN